MRAGLYDEVRSDPPTWQAEAVARLLIKDQHDGVIGLGGGSSLDTAKAGAALATNGGAARDYVGRDRLLHDPLPIIAIPTTAGTGSEVTIWSVLTDEETGAKVSIGSTRIMPAVALLDPELTLGLPPRVTAMTGMDALSHAVESYGSVWNHPIAEGLALQAIEAIGAALLRAVERGEDLEARRTMLQASMVAELAANSTRLGLCHALALPLGARHHVPHGLANALLLPHVVAFNTPADPARYARIANALHAVDAAVTIGDLSARIGTAIPLRDWGIGNEDLESLASMALKSDNVQANPRHADVPELVAILQAAL